jgi:hypothetical protein
VSAHHDRSLLVEVRFLTTDEGGREQSVDLASGRYRTLAAPGSHDAIETTTVQASGEPLLFGIALRAGPPNVRLGESVTAELIALLAPEALDCVASAGDFTIFEGRRIVARGRVVAAEPR